jgi:dolichol-phosphate mannosyltransferase
MRFYLINYSSNLRKMAIIPACHDTERLLQVLSNFKEKVVDEICVVIDCATEKEIALIRGSVSSSDIHIISNNKRQGIGIAIRQGIQYATKRQYDIVVIMAGNGKDQSQEIPRLLGPIILHGYDYVQGSRFLSGGKAVRNPFLRRMFSRLYPFVWTLLTKKNCTDVTNGFRAYRLSLFSNSEININQQWLDRYELEYYIHYKALTLGYKVKEVPVSKIYPFSYKGGYSKIAPFRDWWQIVGPLLYLKIGIKK